jgi:hypothetical protein
MSFLGSAAAVLLGTAGPWMGLGRVTFQLRVEGSPYDASQNDVRVVFSGPGGTYERLAYFDEKGWTAVLAAPEGGTYRAVVKHNGKSNPAVKVSPPLVQLDRRQPGYVRISKDKRFVIDGGAPYWPIGANVGWNSPPGQTVESTLAELGRQGANWARVWACAWDGKNPYFFPETPGGAPRDVSEMNLQVMERWDSVVEAAERSGVRFQFVLFHHGLFSTRVNPNWQDHPWNKAKGGFLEKPGDFFVDPKARRLSKNWLRYAVARWGHSPAVMAWELFNEVEWVDAKYEGREKEIGRWHRDMAATLRSLDPVGRLVTTSSDMKLPIYSAMDFYQPHGYPPSVEAMVLGARVPKDKPFFYGEVGTGSFDASKERMVVRESAWSGFFAGHAGASQYWYWDRLEQMGLYDEIGRAARLIKKSGLAWDPSAKPRKVTVDAPRTSELSFSPGIGWGPTQVKEMRVPRDAEGAVPGRISSYFQGEANRVLFPKPLTLRVEAPEAGRLALEMGPASRNGAKVVVRVDGAVAAQADFSAQENDGGRKILDIAYPKGRSVIVIENVGADWVQINRVSFSNLGQASRALAVASPTQALLRVTSSELGREIGLSGLGLNDGRAEVEVTDLDTGKTRTAQIEVKRGKIRWTPAGKDEALLIRLPAAAS